jgi:hypothetical protein
MPKLIIPCLALAVLSILLLVCVGCQQGVPPSVVDEHMKAADALLAENRRTLALMDEYSKVFMEYQRITQERIARLAADSARCAAHHDDAQGQSNSLAGDSIFVSNKTQTLRDWLIQNGIRSQRDIDFLNATDTAGVKHGIISKKYLDSLDRCSDRR